MKILFIGLTALSIGIVCYWQFGKSLNSLNFDAFPEAQAILVECELPELAHIELSEREQYNQIRDWLLMTVVSNIDLDAEEFNEATFDLPPMRYGFTESTNALQYGVTRYVNVGDGELIALVPPGTDSEIFDQLAHIADEYRRDLDLIPDQLHVFEYDIALDNGVAQITRKKSLTGSTFFQGESSGYVETTINTLQDLSAFIEAADDLTFVGISDNKELTVGGRKLKHRTYGSIQVEDIAAIYQSELGVQRKLRAFNNKWNNVIYTTEEEGEMLLAQMQREQKEQEVVEGSGFSLDPFYDCRGILEYLEYDSKLYWALPTEMYLEVINALNDNNPDLLLSALGYLSGMGQEYSKIADDVFRTLEENFKYQKARYDGSLEGTAVGMHLFYTDLIAKIWTINYGFSAPKKELQEFVCDPDVATSRVFDGENKVFNSVRLWFSPDIEKLQEGKSNRLLFARNATRIYAASSNQFEPGKESPVSAYWGASLDWWNNNYEEVAAFEPEYEKLNEIIKWSFVITWLEDHYAYKDQLSFLSTINVNHSYWFPEWATNNTNLKFNQWKDIQFYPKNFKGASTEVLPLLTSPFSVIGSTVAGGVSLADRTMISKLKPLPKKVKASGRSNRSYLDYAASHDELVTQKGSRYTITGDKVIARPFEQAKLRNRFAELANEPLEKQVVVEEGVTRLKYSHKEVPIGELSIRKGPEAFQVAVSSKAIDRGQYVVRKLSDSPDPQSFLSKSKDVDNYFITEYNQYKEIQEAFIKVDGSDKWVKIRLNEIPEVNLPSNWQARVAGNLEESKCYLLDWIDEAVVVNNNLSEVIRFHPEKGLKPTNLTPGDFIEFKPFELKINGRIVKAHLDPSTNEILFAKADLIGAEGRMPELNQLITPRDIRQIGESIRNQKGSLLYRPRSELPHPSALKGNAFSTGAPKDLAYEQKLSESLSEHLRLADQLLSEGEVGKALGIYDELANVLGKQQPELYLHKAVARMKASINDLGVGSPESSFYHWNRDLLGKKFSAEKGQSFFDQINRILENSGNSIPPWHHIIYRQYFKYHMIGDLKFLNQIDVLGFIGKGKKISKSEAMNALKSGKAKVFVQDQPGLNNLDWSAPTESVFNVIMEKYPNVVFEKLSNARFSSYHPKLVGGEGIMGTVPPKLKLTQLRSFDLPGENNGGTPLNDSLDQRTTNQLALAKEETIIIYLPDYDPTQAFSKQINGEYQEYIDFLEMLNAMEALETMDVFDFDE